MRPDKESLYLVNYYLSLTKQRTKVGSAYNVCIDVIHGILQSTILGPLLLVFISGNLLVIAVRHVVLVIACIKEYNFRLFWLVLILYQCFLMEEDLAFAMTSFLH